MIVIEQFHKIIPDMKKGSLGFWAFERDSLLVYEKNA